MWCSLWALTLLTAVACGSEAAPAGSNFVPLRSDSVPLGSDSVLLRTDIKTPRSETVPLLGSDGLPPKPDADPPKSDATVSKSSTESSRSEERLLKPDALAAASEALPLRIERPRSRTLDRKAAELAWRIWLQSSESRDTGAPPRRVVPKSLFNTPLRCADGYRLDGRDGCVTNVGVDSEKSILEQLGTVFNVEYVDYEDDPLPAESETGPLQLTIPLAYELMPVPSAQSQDSQDNTIKLDKKSDAEKLILLEAELQLMKLQTEAKNMTDSSKKPPLAHVVLNANNLPEADKPKRDSNNVVDTENNKTDQGQKEVVLDGVSADVVQEVAERLAELQKNNKIETSTSEVIPTTISSVVSTTTSTESLKTSTTEVQDVPSSTATESPITTESSEVTTQSSTATTTKVHELKENQDNKKMHPEIDYSDIGEAVKIISRYAEVTTDEMFKDQKRVANIDENPLGTRTKLQYRRKPKPLEPVTYQEYDPYLHTQSEPVYKQAPYAKPGDSLYRYPWVSQRTVTVPPDYPFRHLQDYWQGRSQWGGVYAHENPRRHHHSYPGMVRARHAKPLQQPQLQNGFYPSIGPSNWWNAATAPNR